MVAQSDFTIPVTAQTDHNETGRCGVKHALSFYKNCSLNEQHRMIKSYIHLGRNAIAASSQLLVASVTAH